MNKLKIAGMVTLYNPTDDDIKNIDSYINDIDKLYVIDNTEGKDNKKKLPKNKKIEYIFKNENIGVATALNVAADMALKDGYKWLLTMDQDSNFEENNLSQMIDYLENNDTSKIGLITPWHVINTGARRPNVNIDHPLEVMTSGNIISLDAYKAVGGFKDEYFIDSIDIEYGMNLNHHGYRIDRLNYVLLEHDLGDIKIKYILWHGFVCSNHNYIRRYYIVRNTLYLIDQYKDIYPDYCKMLKKGLRGQFTNILLFEKQKYKKIRNMLRGRKDHKKGIKGKYPYNN